MCWPSKVIQHYEMGKNELTIRQNVLDCSRLLSAVCLYGTEKGKMGRADYEGCSGLIQS